MGVRACYMMPLYKIGKDTPGARLHSLGSGVQAGFLPGTLVQCTTHTTVPFGPKFRCHHGGLSPNRSLLLFRPLKPDVRTS